MSSQQEATTTGAKERAPPGAKKSTSNAGNLPHDIIGVISTFAAGTARDALNVSRVNHRWHETFVSDDAIWQHLSDCRWGAGNTSSFFENRTAARPLRCTDDAHGSSSGSDEEETGEKKKAAATKGQLLRRHRRPVRFTLQRFRAQVSAEATLQPLPRKYLHPIEECEFTFECPVFAERLRPTTGNNFFCDVCRKEVFHVSTQEELDACAGKGRCVSMFWSDVRRSTKRATTTVTKVGDWRQLVTCGPDPLAIERSLLVRIHVYYRDDGNAAATTATETATATATASKEGEEGGAGTGGEETATVRRVRFVMNAIKAAAIEHSGKLECFSVDSFPELLLADPRNSRGFHIKAINVAKMGKTRLPAQLSPTLPSFAVVLGGAATVRAMGDANMKKHVVETLKHTVSVLLVKENELLTSTMAMCTDKNDPMLSREPIDPLVASLSPQEIEGIFAETVIDINKMKEKCEFSFNATQLIQHLETRFMTPRVRRGRMRR